MRRRLLRAAADPEGQVGLVLAGVGLLTTIWFCFWRVPTEVVGRGVLIVPGGATVIDARAPGQILRIPVRVGERVRRGQPLLELYLPTLEQELRRQERDLRELVRLNDDLNRRDGALSRFLEAAFRRVVEPLQAKQPSLPPRPERR